MKAAIIDHFGDLDSVAVQEVPTPTPGPGQVLVRVRAGGIGPWDVATVGGWMHGQQQPEFPMILGWDFAGEVEACGAGVTDLRAGERVLGFTPQAFNGIGAHAERVALPAEAVAPLPESVEYVTAAAIPVAALTARLALTIGRVRAGTRVLLVGAAGQVGGVATQLAVDEGALVIASVAPADAEHVRALGAAAVVDRYGNVGEQVRLLVPGGVDVALDFAGGEARGAAMAAIRDGGHYVTSVVPVLPEAERGIAREIIYVQQDRPALTALARLVADGRLRMRVGLVLDLQEAARAYHLAAQGGVRGKVVLHMQS